jgi:hypothetical protein
LLFAIIGLLMACTVATEDDGVQDTATSDTPVSHYFCPDIPRPALITYGSNLKGLALRSLDGVDVCQIDLPVEVLFSGTNVQALNGTIYFVGANTDTLGYTIWQLTPDGSSQPLPFTTIPGGPTYFTLSDDGRFIAWSYTDPSQNQYKNSLWVANMETGETTALLTDVTDEGDLRGLQPIRFSADNSALFYAFQPSGIGGM